jgi:antitoxin FitA
VKSLRAYLLGVLERRTRFAGNRQLLDEIEHDLEPGGGAGEDAPDAAEVLDQARGAGGSA